MLPHIFPTQQLECSYSWVKEHSKWMLRRGKRRESPMYNAQFMCGTSKYLNGSFKFISPFSQYEEIKLLN